MENLSTDNLMRLQVEQLEKEKRELTEKMRISSKRLDHVERAYRKEERPLLAKDYEIQQANDKAAHEAAQKARVETARLAHQQDLETKKRLLRVVDDYKAYREVIVGKRGQDKFFSNGFPYEDILKKPWYIQGALHSATSTTDMMAQLLLRLLQPGLVAFAHLPESVHDLYLLLPLSDVEMLQCQSYAP